MAGSVVAQTYFEEHFGIIKDGKIDANRDANLSENIVSVLQAGAFFGALGSAPISGDLQNTIIDMVRHMLMATLQRGLAENGH